MNNEEILALPISTLLAPNSYLWLWTTKDHLHFALDCGRHWGLTLKQQFIWVKTTADGSSLKMGLGHWGRNCSENLLLFVRGKPLTLIKRGATNIPNVIFAPRLAHSAKPNCVREAIDRYFPDCSKLEMFARNRSPGWDVWGKEAA